MTQTFCFRIMRGMTLSLYLSLTTKHKHLFTLHITFVSLWLCWLHFPTDLTWIFFVKQCHIFYFRNTSLSTQRGEWFILFLVILYAGNRWSDPNRHWQRKCFHFLFWDSRPTTDSTGCCRVLHPEVLTTLPRITWVQLFSRNSIQKSKQTN